MIENRTQKATKSMITSGIYYITNILLGLLNRRFLILIMGIDYQGVNGLFTIVLSVLEMAELGIGTAIIYHLYKPLAENDINQIKSIMHFYKKCYTIIALVIGIIGCILCVNIEFFVGTTELELNLRLVFLLMLADVIGTYTLAYKRSILYADQKNYIVANVNTCFVVAYNIFQLLILFLTKNYYLYLLVKVILRVGANIIVNIIVNNQYKYLKDNSADPLSKDILSDIVRKVKGLMCHKIGTFVVNGTDNIFISKLVDLTTVGVYANYNYVISAVNSLLNQIIDGATGSIGNLLVKSDRIHRLEVFKEMNLLNLLFSTTAISIFAVAIDDFISVFFGSQYSLEQKVLIVLLVNMIFTNQRRVWGTLKTAAGIQYEDRWVPVFESVINLIMSYSMFKVFGLAGIFIGTIFTHMGVFLYTFPVLVGKRLFETEYKDYLLYMTPIVIYQTVIVFMSFFEINMLFVKNHFISMILKSCLAVMLSGISFLVVFSRKQEFKNLFERFRRLVYGKKSK